MPVFLAVRGLPHRGMNFVPVRALRVFFRIRATLMHIRITFVFLVALLYLLTYNSYLQYTNNFHERCILVQNNTYHWVPYLPRNPENASSLLEGQEVLLLMPTIPNLYKGCDARLLQVATFLTNQAGARLSLAYYESFEAEIQRMPEASRRQHRQQQQQRFATLRLERELRKHLHFDTLVGPLGPRGLDDHTRRYDLILYWTWPSNGYLDMIVRSVRNQQRFHGNVRVLAVADDETHSLRVLGRHLRRLGRPRIEQTVLALRPRSLLSHDDHVALPRGLPPLRPEWRRMVALELRAYLVADLVAGLSRPILAFLRRFVPAKPTMLLRYAVPPLAPSFRRSRGPHEVRRVLFVGHQNPANAAGINWFVQEVLPRLKTTDFRLHVAGLVRAEACSASVARPSANIVCEGALSHAALDLLFSRAAIAINPALETAGVATKTCAALQRGLPVVTTNLDGTTAGLNPRRSLEEYGMAICRARDAVCFARKIDELLNEHELRERASEAGTIFVARSYSLSAIHTDLRLILKKLHRPRLRVLIEVDTWTSHLIGLLQTLQFQPHMLVYAVGEKLIGYGIAVQHFTSFDAIPTGLDFHAVVRSKDVRPPLRICDARCRFILFQDQFEKQFEEHSANFDIAWATSVRGAVPSSQIQILPQGIHCPPSVARSNSDRFSFLYSGPLLHRLSPDVLLRAFDLAFPTACRYDNCSGEPLLTLHTTSEFGFLPSEIAELERVVAQNPRIRWMRQQAFTSAEFDALLSSADCLVMIPRSGELPVIVLEAMVRGVSLLTSSSSDELARGEFVILAPAVRASCEDPDNCWLGSKLSAMCSEHNSCLPTPDSRPLSWFEVSPRKLSHVLREIASTPEKARWRGAMASEYVRSRHCWERVAGHAVDHLDKLLTYTQSKLILNEEFSRIPRLHSVYTTEERFYLLSRNRLWWAFVDAGGRLNIANTASLKLRWTSDGESGSCVPTCRFRLNTDCHLEILNWYGKVLWSSSNDGRLTFKTRTMCNLELTDDGRLIIIRDVRNSLEITWSSIKK